VPAPGPVTHIGDALLNVLRGAQSGAIAAVVLVSDGADNSNDFDAAKVAEIAGFGVPVHTVGVGPEVIEGVRSKCSLLASRYSRDIVAI
jgi:hypothetical protein